MAQLEDEVRRIWKEYFEYLDNIDSQEQVAVQMCGFSGIWRGNYFGGESIGRTEVEVRVGKLKNGKAVGKDEITGEAIKGGGNKVVDWIWRLCNVTFESGFMPEDCRSAVIVSLYKGKGKRTVVVSLYKGKGERTKCKNSRDINLSVVEKIYAEILVDIVRRVTGGLVDDEQMVLKKGGGCRSDLHTKADR